MPFTQKKSPTLHRKKKRLTHIKWNLQGQENPIHTEKNASYTETNAISIETNGILIEKNAIRKKCHLQNITQVRSFTLKKKNACIY